MTENAFFAERGQDITDDEVDAATDPCRELAQAIVRQQERTLPGLIVRAFAIASCCAETPEGNDTLELLEDYETTGIEILVLIGRDLQAIKGAVA